MQQLLNHLNNRRDSLLGLIFSLFVLFDFYFMYVSWGPYPPRNYLSLLLTPFALYDCYKIGTKATIEKYFIPFIYLGMIAVCIALYFIFTQQFIVGIFIKDALKFGTLFLTLSYLVPKIKRRYIVWSIISITGFSILIALFQKFDFNFAYQMRRFISQAEFKSGLIAPGRTRPAGLAYYTLTLAEQIFIFLSVILYYLRKQIRPRWIEVTLLLFIAISVVTINNRIGTLAFLIFLIFLYKDFLLQRKKLVFATFFTLALISIWLGERFRLFNYEHGNDSLRIDAWLASLIILKDNWLLGLGENYANIKLLISQTKDSMPFLLSPKRLGEIGPHNFFINTLLRYGLIGLLALVYLFHNLIRKSLSNNTLLFYLIVTSISSMAHNGGILNTSTLAMGLIIIMHLHSNNKSLYHHD